MKAPRPQRITLRGLLSGMIKLPFKPLEKPEPKETKRPRHWAYGEMFTQAHTKSEARAHFKRRLGLDRLPIGAVVVCCRRPHEETQP